MDDAQNIDIFSGDYLSTEPQATDNPFVETPETIASTANGDLTAWWGSGSSDEGCWWCFSGFESEPFLSSDATPNPDPFAPATFDAVEVPSAPGDSNPLFGEMPADTGLLTGF